MPHAAPRVSVIMASFNHADFVGKAVNSVLSQSFTDFEFVITDDGSSDATVDVIRGYSDPRIQLEVFSRNRGACHAMNCCIRRSKGKYISVINSDDWFFPGKLATQVQFLDRNRDIAAVFGKPLMVDEAGTHFPRRTIRSATPLSTICRTGSLGCAFSFIMAMHFVIPR